MLVRVMEQAVRDGIIDRNPARVTGWRREYQRAEDELDDPRALALPDWETLTRLAAALVERSVGAYQGWGEVVIFAACTAARIGEVSGVRAGDIDCVSWTWTVRRQTTPSPGGLVDKGTKGKRARKVPLIAEVRDLVARRLDALGSDPAARLFTGPRGGADHHRGSPGRDPLGRSGDQAGFRAPSAPRPSAHGTDLDGGCRRAGACAPEDRRAWLAEHDAALPSPGRALDLGRGGGVERSSLGAPVPKWSPAAGGLETPDDLADMKKGLLT
ncbi:hypothetical protein Ssi03_41950 [Sphaerisporangium siamense]|nr:hypothetical protein Ssi03_41950 [Sphaerisporangium siamense]